MVIISLLLILVNTTFYEYNRIASSLHLQNIRHIVIEDMNMKNHSGKTFIPNSISLNCIQNTSS